MGMWQKKQRIRSEILCEVAVSQIRKKSEKVNSRVLSPSVNALDTAIKNSC